MERFKASIEAFARRDEAEIVRLQEHCPSTTYRIQDLAYFDRLREVALLAFFHATFVRDDALGLLSSMLIVLRSLNQTENQPSDTQTASNQRIEEAEENCGILLARVLAREKAFDRFCDDIGSRPASVRKMCGIGNLTAIFEGFGFESEDPSATDWFETLRDMWRKSIDERRPGAR